MTASRYCPICNEFALGFVARATYADLELVEVVAQCQHCRYMFLHHFDFEEMLSEETVTELLQKITDHIDAAAHARPDAGQPTLKK